MAADNFLPMASGSSKSSLRKDNLKNRLQKREPGSPENSLYQTIVENAAVALWSAPFDSFDFTYLNPGGEKIYGYPREECLQSGFLTRIIVPDEREWVEEYSRLAVQEKHTYQLEYHIKTGKGKVRAIRDTINLTYKNGKPFLKVGVSMDVSVYKETLNELQASNRRFYSAFHKFPIPALLSRVKDAQIIDLNKNFLEISGYDRNELVGKSAFATDAWADPAEKNQVINFIRKSGRIEKYPVLLRDAWGRVRNILLSAEIFDNNGEMCVLLMFYDVTEQIKTEERLQQINRELETFMYKSSHNLKGPVASIKGLLYLAGLENSGEKMKEYIVLLQQSTRGLEVTLEELMDITRLKQGNVKPELVDVAAMAEEISNRLRFMPEWQNISFRVSVRQKSPFYTDAGMLRSVLQNLMENAVKYKNEKVVPKIRISVIIQKKVVEILVKDNGIGIPEEQQERIFEMFYRAHQKASGTGLGLYIVKSSVEKLGGIISLQSKEGQGSLFRITLPNNRRED